MLTSFEYTVLPINEARVLFNFLHKTFQAGKLPDDIRPIYYELQRVVWEA